ncbi:hypothetical protein ACFXOL_20900 [Streptomyces californicus]|uniref:hypothetical protein n=1 Tax=Streptomyces TaxID=1883 RepID=UPI00051752D2|nr:hypothetical protein [Streptomyces griseus]
MTKPSLYGRYMGAAAAVREHDASCATCSRDRRCAAGRRLFDVLERLQDAYFTHQRSTRGTS